MRTMQFQETDSAAQIAKHHQFLAEDLDPMGQIFQFVGKADRLPKAAKIFATRRVGADMGEFGVFIGHLAMEVAAKSRLQIWGPTGHSRPPVHGWKSLENARVMSPLRRLSEVSRPGTMYVAWFNEGQHIPN